MQVCKETNVPSQPDELIYPGVAIFWGGCRSVRAYLGKWRSETSRAAADAIGSCALAMGTGSAFWPHAMQVVACDGGICGWKNHVRRAPPPSSACTSHAAKGGVRTRRWVSLFSRASGSLVEFWKGPRYAGASAPAGKIPTPTCPNARLGDALNFLMPKVDRRIQHVHGPIAAAK